MSKGSNGLASLPPEVARALVEKLTAEAVERMTPEQAKAKAQESLNGMAEVLVTPCSEAHQRLHKAMQAFLDNPALDVLSERAREVLLRSIGTQFTHRPMEEGENALIALGRFVESPDGLAFTMAVLHALDRVARGELALDGPGASTAPKVPPTGQYL